MKRIIKYIPILIAGAVLVSSCNKEDLDTMPTSQVSEGSIFTTTSDARKAVEGIYRLFYRQFYSTQSLGGQSANMIYMDALGEDLVMTGQSNGWFISDYKWVNHRISTSTISYFNYLFYFTIVSNANSILKYIDAAAGTQAEKDAIKGEALSLRGWAYFQMIQLFGKRFVKGQANDTEGVPLKLEPSTVATPRATVAAIYEQINKDLDAAMGFLASSPARSNKSKINLSVAKGLKARVALTQQEYALAAQLASEARQGYELMSNTEYMAGFSSYTNREWMWGMYQQEDQTTFFYSFFAFMSANYNSTNTRTNPKAIFSKLYDKISATDVRKGLWDPTGTNTAFPIPLNPSGSRFPYMNRKFLVPNTAISNGDLVIMRASEMYLIQAEALARLGGRDAEARQALYTLAHQRDASYVLSTNSGAELIEEVMTQRRIELWGEGFRFYDLKRTNTPLNRNGGNHNGSLVGIYDVPANDVKWEFLIPQDEINYSNNIVKQNPL